MEVETTGAEEPTSTDDLLEQAKKRFKLAQETEDAQRQREKDDLRFQVPEEQWDENARRQRLGAVVDGVPTPARPVLSIPKLDQPIQLVLNQERAAKLGVSIKPLSPDAGVEEAIILEGLYRRIERDSQANVARSWAFDRAVKCGRGAYRVNTEYDESGGHPSDQVIRIERILHQNSVYFDPSATKPDFSDGEWAFITSWMPIETFKREFPESKVDAPDIEFADLVEDSPEWVRGDKDDGAVLVAEYFYKKHRLEDVGDGENKRKRDVVTVEWCKLTGFEVLEKGEWNGKWIPLIPVIGKELQPYDEERRWVGIIGPAKDAQRLYNYAASSAVEVAALEPKAPYVGYAESIEGYEDEWMQSNIRNFPMLRVNPVFKGGVLLPPPVRSQVDVGRLGPSMQLLQQADQFIQVTTATYDPGLGRESSRDKSGKAILALQQQGEAGSSHYLHNLADISMNYEARVILDLIPTIYDRPERLARTLDEEGEADTVMLNAPFYSDPESKLPVALQPGQQPPMPPGPPMPQQGPPGAAAMPPGAPMMGGPPPGPGGPPQGPPMPPSPPKVKHYNLRRGIYSVAISIGKQRQTALQESAEEIGQILQSNPQLMTLLGPIYFENRDFPGARSIAKLFKKIQEKEMPFLSEDDENQPSPEQMQAQIQQMGQQIEQMGQALEQASKAIETDQAKQQATMQKAEMDNQTRLQISQSDNETRLLLAEMAGELKKLTEGLKVTHDGEQKDFDREQQELDREHDAAKVLAAPVLAPFTGSATEPLEKPPGGKEL